MELQALVWTEGKTDWQHLKRAFDALKMGPRIGFHENEADFGDDQLLKHCQVLSQVTQPLPTIFVFDRDNDQLVNKIEDSSHGYKAWGNNVYSFAIPVPAHRTGEPRVCLELYYTDEQLRTPDEAGRRIFLSTEFNATSGRVIADPKLSIGNKGRLPSGKTGPVRVVDSEVYNDENHNVALSKADFARCVVEGRNAFAHFTFDAFKPILDTIDRIVTLACGGNDLPFGDFDSFLKSLEGMDASHELSALLDAAIRVSKLATMILVAATLRHYERLITDPLSDDVRKVRPIKEILAASFGAPALSTLQKLARHSYHLIDDRAPSALLTLRSIMAVSPTLGPIGDMLEQLERLLPTRSHARTLNQRGMKKPLLEYVLPQLARYEGRITELTDTVAASGALRGDADPATWREALVMLVRLFEPLRNLPFRIRSIEKVISNTDEFLVLLTTYRNGRIDYEQTTQVYVDIPDDRLVSYELVPEEADTALDMFPFITIKGDRLYYYHRTKPQGYEYLPAFGPLGDVWPTKRKFGNVALRSVSVSDRQGLFWAQVTPSISDAGVKANIPTREPIVGRRQQIENILADIVQIPNQNGIIYGPGGVGKTALLIELSSQLFETPAEGAYFKNIIWVSAKCDSYDPALGVTEPRAPQFRTMENILDVILDFHELEDASTYELDDKKWLVLESLRDEKTLLILDNLETVSGAERDAIIKFFGLEAKRALKARPEYFKVLITSREMISSGFHQIELKGLDKRESKELMGRLYEPYRQSGKQQLSNEQIDAVYETSRGIPLIIKHCYGQYYEFDRPLDTILKGLSSAGNKVVEFSFSEVFQLLKQDDLELKTLLVLELSGRPLMARQVADILGLAEPAIAERLNPLVKFQCVTRVTVGREEKYMVNEIVRFFTRRLTIEFPELATKVKRQIVALPIEKRMDYSKEEADIALLFCDYAAQGHHLSAEESIKDGLKNHPTSVLLNLHYAKYLRDVRQQPAEAIARLEIIRNSSGNDPEVLVLLMAYNVALAVPNFEQAHVYAKELESVDDNRIRIELARFYVAWSIGVKMRFELDPLREMIRQQQYKELADTAIRILKEIHEHSHEWYYLNAQSFYNKWDYESARLYAERAIDGLPKGSHLLGPYSRLRVEILKKRAYFANRVHAGV